MSIGPLLRVGRTVTLKRIGYEILTHSPGVAGAVESHRKMIKTSQFVGNGLVGLFAVRAFLK